MNFNKKWQCLECGEGYINRTDALCCLRCGVKEVYEECCEVEEEKIPLNSFQLEALGQQRLIQ